MKNIIRFTIAVVLVTVWAIPVRAINFSHTGQQSWESLDREASLYFETNIPKAISLEKKALAIAKRDYGERDNRVFQSMCMIMTLNIDRHNYTEAWKWVEKNTKFMDDNWDNITYDQIGLLGYQIAFLNIEEGNVRAAKEVLKAPIEMFESHGETGSNVYLRLKLLYQRIK